MPSKTRGRYKKDEQLREEERSKQKRALDAGRKKKVRAAAKKRRTEREFLSAMAAEFDVKDAKAIMQIQTARARLGDPAALAFISKHILGGGRLSLADVARPPMIRRTRR